MSGVLMAVMGTSGGRLTGNSGNISNVSTLTGIRSGTFTLVNDGTYTNTGSAGSNWFTPTTSGVGSQWSAKAVINTQTTTSPSGTFNSFVSLSSGASWTFANTATNVEGTGSMTISFSPDGGTTTVGTMTVGWDVGYTP